VLSKRLITGPILILVLLVLVALDEQLIAPSGDDAAAIPRGGVLLVLCMLVSIPACLELAAVARGTGRRSAPLLLIVAVWSLLLTMWSQSTSGTLPGVTMLVVAATWWAALVVHARGQRTSGVLAAASVTTATVVYLGMLGFYLLLRQDVSAWWIAAVVLITKSCDIGAYFTGMTIGKHRLIPWLSPGKTVEGLAGGVLCAVLVSIAATSWLGAEGFREVSTGTAMLLGVLLALGGQAGDLTMSLMKRDATQKDSGSVLPGMGGVMDVLDSPLLAAPIAWLVLSTC